MLNESIITNRSSFNIKDYIEYKSANISLEVPTATNTTALSNGLSATVRQYGNVLGILISGTTTTSIPPNTSTNLGTVPQLSEMTHALTSNAYMQFGNARYGVYIDITSNGIIIYTPNTINVGATLNINEIYVGG